MQQISLSSLKCHPNNTAPYSIKYRANVYDDRVEQLIKLIDLNGFDGNYPLIVRAMIGDKKPYYEVVEGNHRLCAVRALHGTTGLPKWSSVPCIIKEMTDYEVAIAQITRQGRPIDTYIHARHLYKLLGDQTDDRQFLLKAINEYALMCGLSVRNVKGLYKIGVVDAHLKKYMNPKHYDLIEARISSYILEELIQLPDYQWSWFALYFVQNNTSFARAREIIICAKYATADMVYDPIKQHLFNKIYNTIVKGSNNLEKTKDLCMAIYNEEVPENLRIVSIDNKPVTPRIVNTNQGYTCFEIGIDELAKLPVRSIAIVRNYHHWDYAQAHNIIVVINDVTINGNMNGCKLNGKQTIEMTKTYLISPKKICNPCHAKVVTIFSEFVFKLEGIKPCELEGIENEEVGGLIVAIMKAINVTSYYVVS